MEDLGGFVRGLLDGARDRPTLAGFDTPLGLPRAYGERTGLAGFHEALAAFGNGAWADVFRPAVHPEEIALARPFYPARPGGASRAALARGLGLPEASLMRRCERGGPGRKAAGTLFWTLGANQTGRAAAVAWQAVAMPARQAGARLWPFESGLDPAGAPAGLVLCETYPADVYARLGLRFGAGEGKGDRAVRHRLAPALEQALAVRGGRATPRLRDAVASGFDRAFGGDDGFDAVVGLLGMIDVVAGRHPAGLPADDEGVLRWEGWILGRQV